MDADFAADLREFIRLNSRTLGPGQLSHSETDHPEHFISVPAMRSFLKDWLAANPLLSKEVWCDILDRLYRGESMEEKCMAGMMLGAQPRFRKQLDLAHLDGWLNELTGWKEVDTTCQAVFLAPEILARWDEWEPFLRQLSDDSNINRRRASLVFLVAVVRASDDPRGINLAVELITKLRQERDKRIAKAVSWVLREAVKRHRARVSEFLQHYGHDLSNTVVREAETKLQTGKKVLKPPQDA